MTGNFMKLIGLFGVQPVRNPRALWRIGEIQDRQARLEAIKFGLKAVDLLSIS